jgi:hypothetical protein
MIATGIDITERKKAELALHPFFEKTRIFPQPRAADPD